MFLGYFTEEAYDKLLNDVDINLEKYSGAEDWLTEYFGNDAYFALSSVEVNKFNPHYTGNGNEDENDFINARNLYEAFKITPLQATNKYMWAYMCHANQECRKYIQTRWGKSSVSDRYFVSGDGLGLYYWNALSRLWWWAHLTYDKDNTRDPYALTKILFENQMVGRDFLGTLNGRNFNRTKGVLLALKDFKELVGSKEGIDKYFRESNKILNRYAAINVFDFLDAEEIKKIAYDTLVKVRSNMKE